MFILSSKFKNPFPERNSGCATVQQQFRTCVLLKITSWGSHRMCESVYYMNLKTKVKIKFEQTYLILFELFSRLYHDCV